MGNTRPLRNSTSLPTTADIIEYNSSEVYPAGSTGEKLTQTISVTDAPFFADNTGAVSASTAFTSAASNVTTVIVPVGTYLLSTTPTITGILQVNPGATLTGAGASPLGYTVSNGIQYLQNTTTSTDFATMSIRRNANHTGGTPGFVNSAFRVDHYVLNSAITNFEWAVVGVMHNYASAGENVGGYFIGYKHGLGATWGGLFEAIETTPTNNPTSGLVACELDLSVNGTDSVFPYGRVGSDLAIRRFAVGGADAEAGWGYRIQNGGYANSLVRIGFGFFTGMKGVIAFDCSQGTISGASLCMAAGVSISFDAGLQHLLSYDGAGLVYAAAGSAKIRLGANGSIGLNGSTTIIYGTFSTGTATATLSATKPGANGGVATWLNVTINGTQGWIPVFLN